MTLGYANVGLLEEAWQVFNKMPLKNAFLECHQHCLMFMRCIRELFQGSFGLVLGYAECESKAWKLHICQRFVWLGWRGLREEAEELNLWENCHRKKLLWSGNHFGELAKTVVKSIGRVYCWEIYPEKYELDNPKCKLFLEILELNSVWNLLVLEAPLPVAMHCRL